MLKHDRQRTDPPLRPDTDRLRPVRYPSGFSLAGLGYWRTIMGKRMATVPLAATGHSAAGAGLCLAAAAQEEAGTCSLPTRPSKQTELSAVLALVALVALVAAGLSLLWFNRIA